MTLKRKKLTLMSLAAAMILTGCTTDELNALGEGLARGLAEASADLERSNYYGNSYYTGPYYSPGGFSSYSGWRYGAGYGDYVGYRQCRNIGTYYTCDSDGDGYADMYGDTSDGSYASSNLRVNGRGEAFTWGRECGCWERNRAYDGERKTYYDRYDKY
jgi:hypothetical protein